MKIAYYIFAVILFIYSVILLEQDNDYSETVLIVGWLFFIGASIVEKIEKLEKKIK